MAVISVCGEIIAVGKTQPTREIISQLEDNGINELLITKASVEMQFLGSHLAIWTIWLGPC